MLDWLARNSEVVSLAVNAAMLAVWLAYLQVFLKSYGRQVRPKIVINRGAGTGLESRCFISNMGSNAIYLEDILLHISASGNAWQASILDFGSDGAGKGADPKTLTHQGPLSAGDYTIIGTYGELIAYALTQSRAPTLEDLFAQRQKVSLRVEVLADHAADDLLIGARRRFLLEPAGPDWRLAPVTLETEQVRSRRARRNLQRRFAEELEVVDREERA